MESENVSTMTGAVEEDELKNDAGPGSNPAPRESLINSAVKFLLNPKVAISPMHQKRAFLLSKGLAEDEIVEACRRAGVPKDGPPPTKPLQQPYTMAPHQTPYAVATRGPSWLQNLRDIFQFVALLTGAAYGCYYLWKRYITQWLFGTREKSTAELNLETSMAIQKSMSSLMTSVETLQTTLDKHCATLQKIFGAQSSLSTDADWRKEMGQIRDEIKSVKGIMLGTSRFPTNPPIKPISIPNWQLDTVVTNDDKKKTNPPMVSTVNGVESLNLARNGEVEIEVVSSNPDLVT